MPYHVGDTICAIASAAGGAARGIVRVSGPCALSIVEDCRAGGDGRSVQSISSAAVVSAHLQVALGERASAGRLPCSLYVWPTSRSYTREPVVELHMFGSPQILEAVVATLCRAGARLAEPGEFTLRAFLAGRIDLTQAEAVLGVIDASGKDELHAALAQLAGGLAQPLTRLRDGLLQLLAELEAGLDFVDEDIEFISSNTVIRRMDAAIALLDQVSRQMASRDTSEQMPQVVLVGAPNAGKSSLFNALVECYGAQRYRRSMQPAALVSPIEGTTRDYLTAPISFDGVQFELIDTAGIVPAYSECQSLPFRHSRQTSERTVEAQAQGLATERSVRADVRAYCIDASNPLSAADFASRQRPMNSRVHDLIILTKSDLAPPSGQPLLIQRLAGHVVITSSRTGEGLAALCEALRGIFSGRQSELGAKGVRTTAERCRESIRLAAAALSTAEAITIANGGAELVAEELRAALDELGKVVGAVYTDDLLDRIFNTFCIGK